MIWPQPWSSHEFGDTLAVWKFDRLGRSVKEILTLAEELHDREVGLRSLTGALAGTYTPTGEGKFFFTIMATFAELERGIVHLLTMAGARRGLRPRPRRRASSVMDSRHQPQQSYSVVFLRLDLVLHRLRGPLKPTTSALTWLRSITQRTPETGQTMECLQEYPREEGSRLAIRVIAAEHRISGSGCVAEPEGLRGDLDTEVDADASGEPGEGGQRRFVGPGLQPGDDSLVHHELSGQGGLGQSVVRAVTNQPHGDDVRERGALMLTKYLGIA